MNTIFTLIFIASVIYKIYENYQKEQASAKERREKKFRPDTAFPEIKREIPSHNPPRELIPEFENYDNKYAAYTSAGLPQEVIDARANKKRREYLKSLQVEDIDNKETTNDHQIIEFDLKQAIINSAILERPYK